MRRFFIRCLCALLAPPTAWWVRLHEQRIRRELTPEESALAEQVGVHATDQIRILVVETVPMPGPRWIHRLAQRLSLPAMKAVGMSLGHGVYLQRGFEHRIKILVHECVHTAHYERHGISGFLRRYLPHCLEDGHINAELEREAVRLSEQACASL
ncbi:MAG: hypothetical protein ACI8T1_002904 [Verrucomicrobiales bacterium]|jgi:hypothetical protein